MSAPTRPEMMATPPDTMTRMSELHGRRRGAGRAKLLQSRGGSRLARAVQDRGSIVTTGIPLALCATLVGCVIPPSLKVEDDAGVNSPPAILSVTGTSDALAEPGPYFVESQSAGALTVSVIDTDVADTLFLRIFVDYNIPVGDRPAPRVKCAVPQTNQPVRTATCNLAGICQLSEAGEQHNMTIVVFDRMPVDDGDNPQSMLGTDGMSTSRFYFVRCQLPQ